MSQPNQSASLFAPEPFKKPSHWSEPPDITERRHGGNKNSIAANPTQERKEIDREKILRLITEHVALDIHQLEILMGKSANKFSGRLTALKVAGKIQDCADMKWRLKP